MRKKTRKRTLGLCIAGLFAMNVTFAQNAQLQDIALRAISLTKAAGDYGKFTITLSNSQNSTVRLPAYEISDVEGQFKIAVEKSWNASQTGNTGFLTYLALEDQKWIMNSQTGTLSMQDRAKNLLLDKYYISFLHIWDNPNDTFTPTPVYNNPPSTNTQVYRTFSEVKRYTTISGKSYTIRKSNDNKYRFNQTSRYGFRSQSDLTNFLEQQNRIIYTAPNGRMYGIFRMNGRYIFNRDEGSLSQKTRSSLSDVKAYINQHNQPLANCQRAKEWRCM